MPEYQGEHIEFNVTESCAEDSDYTDKLIECIECRAQFIWSAGEQRFFSEKGLDNPPKRCRPCKKAKNQRIEAIYSARAMGKKFTIMMPVSCDECGRRTTVPFYPSQGRPVYCRQCFDGRNSLAARTAGSSTGP